MKVGYRLIIKNIAFRKKMYGRNRRSPSPMNDRRGGGGRGGGRYHILIKNIAFEVDWKKLKDIIKVIPVLKYLKLKF